MQCLSMNPARWPTVGCSDRKTHQPNPDPIAFADARSYRRFLACRMKAGAFDLVEQHVDRGVQIDLGCAQNRQFLSARVHHSWTIIMRPGWARK